MNGNMLFLIALMGGNGLSKEIVQAMSDAQRDTYDRWKTLLTALGNIITTGVFVLRGMPAPVDQAGNPSFTNEALSAQIKASFEEGKREAFWVSVVNGVVAAVLEFLRPSAIQNTLLMGLVNRPGMMPATTTTTITNLPAVPASTTMTQATPFMNTLAPQARTAGQVLRATPTGFVRAQAIYVNPQTGEMAFE